MGGSAQQVQGLHLLAFGLQEPPLQHTAKGSLEEVRNTVPVESSPLAVIVLQGTPHALASISHLKQQNHC